MKHLGDVCKINGANIDPVDVVTFGAPCQDLSIAGKRTGMKHTSLGDEETTRSGLFFESIRIIKELRKADELRNGATNIRPRYAVYENVPGAFSSNKGEDFRAVLEETARVVDKDAVIPRPPKDKWTNAGAIMGNGWSIAWRVMDAQFWGVPQRRRRIALVADFGGESAPEILLKPESVSGHFAESRAQRERTAGDVEGGFGAAGFKWGQGAQARSIGWSEEVSPTLPADAGGNTAPAILAYSFDSLSSNSMKSSNPHSGCREVEVAKCLDTTDPNPSKNQGGVAVVQLCGDRNNPSVSWSDKAYCLPANPMSDRGQAVVQPQLYEAYQHHGWRKGETSGTLTVGQNNTVRGDTPLVTQPQTLKIRSGCEGGGKGALIQDNLSATLGCNNDQTLFVPTYCLQGNGIDRADTAGCNGKGWTEDVCYTLNTIDRPAVFSQDAYDKFAETNNCASLKASGGNYGGGSENICTNQMTVRRLTPLECSRLQGYPDDWAHIPGWKNPTKEEVEWWTEVHYNWGVITSDKPEKVKRKTEKYIRKWLKNPCSDSAEYKAYGNSIALPQWRYVLGNICDQLGRKATLGSLFDGIGGFPLVWQEINGNGSAKWASEIEPFPIAVTKYRINEMQNEEESE